MKKKNILTIETSLDRILLAIIRNEEVLVKTLVSSRSIEEDINTLLSSVIKEAAIKFNEIDIIFVSLGPGSFTGIRIGISVAKAIAISTGAKIFGYSNFDSVLCQFFSSNKIEKNNKIQVLIKGPGDEFFKKVFINNNFQKKNNIITKTELLKTKNTTSYLNVGSFLDTFNIKNYFFSLPTESGIKYMIRNQNKNLKINFSKSLSPIYIREHYAKKNYRENL